MVFPELLAGVLAGYSGEDFLAACKENDLLASASKEGVEEKRKESRKRTWMLILELGKIIDILIDGNVKIS